MAHLALAKAVAGKNSRSTGLEKEMIWLEHYDTLDIVRQHLQNLHPSSVGLRIAASHTSAASTSATTSLAVVATSVRRLQDALRNGLAEFPIQLQWFRSFDRAGDECSASKN